jgi:hypothetical protein
METKSSELGTRSQVALDVFVRDFTLVSSCRKNETSDQTSLEKHLRQSGDNVREGIRD